MASAIAPLVLEPRTPDVAEEEVEDVDMITGAWS
jgi:hypothetical protein